MAPSEILAATLAALTLSACSVVADFDEFESPGSSCEPDEELCDGRDNDCDDAVDEGFDTQSDAFNCGGCGRICVAPDNTNPVCNAGICGIGCPTGFGDCDDDAGNGCEASLAEPATCGSCDNPCGAGDVCRDGTCVADCGAGFIECDGRCIAEGLPPQCGSCDGTCSFSCGAGPGTCVAPASVVASQISACAVGEDGMLVCWGRNNSGELTLDDGLDRATPIITQTTDVVQLTGGSGHFCAVLGDGRLICWGDNRRGQLGTETPTDTSATPVEVALAGVTKLDAGAGHTCAAADDLVYCWGDNSSGQVNPTGDSDFYDTPQMVGGLGVGNVVAMAAGGSTTQPGHTCVAQASGSVGCWGHDEFDQVSAGSTSTEKVHRIEGAGGAHLLAAGGRHTCAALTAEVVCWGANSAGQQGIGTTTGGLAVREVTQVVGSNGWNVVELRAGNIQTCARLSDGSVNCWGSNQLGQLGNGESGMFMPAPVLVSAPASPATDIATGSDFSCTVSAGGIFCFGRNNRGQLGRGENSAFEAVPMQANPPTLP